MMIFGELMAVSAPGGNTKAFAQIPLLVCVFTFCMPVFTPALSFLSFLLYHDKIGSYFNSATPRSEEQWYVQG